MSHQKRHIQIIADDREKQSGVIRCLKGLKNVSVQIERLSIGDYIAENKLVFERKTLDDFVLSIIDGRLFKQACRLASLYDKRILILEGTAKDFNKTGIRREALQGAIISISIILGIPILRARDPSETARLIVFATRQVKSLAEGSVYRHGYRPKDRRKRQLFLLQGLPGIGREKAQRLIDRFGSIEAIITADCEDLQYVKGIGRVIARNIKDVVTEPKEGHCLQDDVS
jgi:DNA excision repair protein ERCC-4